jgi:hypothetical protein
MPVKRFQHVKTIKEICIQHRKLVEKIKQTYRLKVLPDRTIDDSCNLAYKILDLVRSPLLCKVNTIVNVDA